MGHDPRAGRVKWVTQRNCASGCEAITLAHTYADSPPVKVQPYKAAKVKNG